MELSIPMSVNSSTDTIGTGCERRTESGSVLMSDMSMGDIIPIFPEEFVVSLFCSC